MKLSLAIIAKNNEKTLPALFDSIKGVFDEIVFVDTGSTDKTKSIAEKYGAKIYDFEWCDDFSKARQFAFDQCTNDWVMWLDTDDTVEHAERIREIVEKADSKKTVGSIFLKYHYSFDENGNLETVQWRERIVRRADYVWKGRIHEVLVNTRSLSNVKSNDIIVIHHLEHGEAKERSLRNLRILSTQLNDELKEGKPDPRTLFYIAKTFHGIGEYKEALKYFTQYVQVSGWEEEVYHAWTHISMIYRELREYNKAILAAANAWKIYPQSPDAYLHAGWAYQAMKKYDKSNTFLELCMQMKPVDFDTVNVPKNNTIIPLKMLANNYVDMNKIDKAIEAHRKIITLVPNDQESLSILEKLNEYKAEMDKVVSYYEKFEKIKDDKEKVKKLYESIPAEYRHYPSIIKIKNHFDIKEESTGKDVAIYCGASIEEWSPDSEKTGIGGSEEAVINMARELSTLGMRVTVYNSVQEEQIFNGVTYKPWYSFNPKDKWDYFIAWRNVELFDGEFNATHKYLWLHDLMNPNDFTESRIKNIDKIIVVSQFHRETLPNIADDKFYITSNGVNTSLFDQKVKRAPHKAVYTSAYDRGLEQLLDMWPLIRKEVPDAILTICYGWKGFDALWQNNPERLAWKEKIVKKIESLKDQGVEELGRISHKDVAWHMLNASVWTYPTTWPETNCITALKAQIAGAIPVVHNYAALEQTVQYGVKLKNNPTQEYQPYVDEIVSIMLNPKDYEESRKVMSKDMTGRYSWRAIAGEWVKDLFV